MGALLVMMACMNMRERGNMFSVAPHNNRTMSLCLPPHQQQSLLAAWKVRASLSSFRLN
jgi:hypothetical protein